MVAGLFAGLTLPTIALVIKDWLPQLISLLLFVSAYRIGPRATLGERQDFNTAFLRILAYQLAAPLAALALLHLTGWANLLPGIALVLVLAAPSISGAPNFAIMMGHDPTRAMRLLLLGTALFPLTVVPIFLALPAIPTLLDVLISAGRLLVVITLAVGLGFALRRDTTLSDESREVLDGIAALLLAVIVVGLMAAMGPALIDTPLTLLYWVGFAFAVNFGLQMSAYALDPAKDVGTSIAAGNRNIALFLIALPQELSQQLLIFIGSYQLPMYLTPILMRYVYRSR